MGSCVSCESSSNDHQSEHKLQQRGSQSSHNTVPEVAECGSVVGGGGIGMRDGGGTPGGASSGHKVISESSSASISLKGEKKTFYSRIPPLGRTGSTTEKNKHSTSSSAIKDNNNYSESKIAALYEHYKDPLEEAITADGIDRLCRDLDVKPEDFKMLLLAWKFNAEQMCRFSKGEFFQGMKELKTDTLPGVQARLPDILVDVMADPTKFKDLYRFSFKFGLDKEIGQRVLPLDMAVSLWRVVFSLREPPLLDRWIKYLEAQPHVMKGVPGDTWNMFLNFVDTVSEDLSNYDDSEAWPSVFDDFVEYENDQLNQNTIISNNDGKNQFQQNQQQQQQQVLYHQNSSSSTTSKRDNSP